MRAMIPNVKWRFDEPMDRVPVYDSDDMPVGSFIRLVDLDPTSGHTLVRVTKVLGRQQRGAHVGPRCFYEVEVVPNSFVHWAPRTQP